MKLPKKVEEQARLAEDLHTQTYGNTSTEAPKEEPKVEPVPAASAPPENATAPVEHKDDYEAKYKVLSGKYSTEVPRMAAEIRQLKEQTQKLEAELNAARNQPSVPPTVKPEEVERYGEEFVDFTRRVAQSVSPEVGEIKKTVDQLRAEQERLARDRFFSDLATKAPQWETLNTDSGFLAWLAELDPYTGRPRQELFDDAYSRWDAWRVANFFNSYGGTKPAAASPKPSLEEQVVPSASRAESPPPAKKVYTVSQVQKFYSDVRNGRYSPDEAGRIERDIFAAQAEGRLRPG